jgi:hypothetical protein
MRVSHDACMEYIIGAGAILESGENGSITPASLHAHVDSALAERVKVAAIDFESTSPESVKRLLILSQGWNAAQFRAGVTDRLRTQRECTLADVLRMLAEAAGVSEVHLFAHWLPDEATCAELERGGVEVVCHPLESIDAASLVCEQRRELWRAA